MSREVSIPTPSLAALNAFAKMALKEQIPIFDLNSPDQAPSIATGSTSLDWVTDCGGLPRGRVIEFSGTESAGKCVLPNTIVSIPGEGLVQIGEIVARANWGDLDEGGKPKPDSKAEFSSTEGALKICSADLEPSDVVSAYFAGTVRNAMEVELVSSGILGGSSDHRILVLPDNGIGRWVALAALKERDLVFCAGGYRVFGSLSEIGGYKLPTDSRTFLKIPNDTAEEEARKVLQETGDTSYGNLAVLVSLLMSERRLSQRVLALQSRRQLRVLKLLWEQSDFKQTTLFRRDSEKFSTFSFLFVFTDPMAEVYEAVSEEMLRNIGKTSEECQKGFLQLAFELRGAWTKSDLELELENEGLAKMLQAIAANLGIRMNLFRTLNTLSEARWKLSVFDSYAYEGLLSIWEGEVPLNWDGKTVMHHERNGDQLKPLLGRVREVLGKSLLELPDRDHWTKSQLSNLCLEVNEVRVSKRATTRSIDRIYHTINLLTHPNLWLDRVASVQDIGNREVVDLCVPIGSWYIAGGVLSHNSTLALHCCKVELTDQPRSIVAYMDYERSTATAYARKMGLEKFKTPEGGQRFLLMPMDSLQQGDAVFESMIKTGAIPSILVVDSVAAMTPQAMFDKDAEKIAPVALQARLLSELLSKWVKFAGDYGITIILINQVRTHISMDRFERRMAVPGIQGSEKEMSPGGMAVKFYAAMRLDVRPQKIVKSKVYNPLTGSMEEVPVANAVSIVAKKNKCGRPYRKATIHITYGMGIDVERTMVDLSEGRDFINKEGGEYQLVIAGEILARGNTEESLIEFIRNSPDRNAIVRKIEIGLGFDTASDSMEHSLGTVTVSVATGNVIDRGVNAAAGIAGIREQLEAVEGSSNLFEKASAVGLISKKGRGYYWSPPGGKTEVKGATPENFLKSLGKNTLALEMAVADKVSQLEEMLNRITAVGQTPVPQLALGTATEEELSDESTLLIDLEDLATLQSLPNGV